jgi:hypothetical protein
VHHGGAALDLMEKLEVIFSKSSSFWMVAQRWNGPIIVRPESECMTRMMRYDHMAQQLKDVLPVVTLHNPRARSIKVLPQHEEVRLSC